MKIKSFEIHTVKNPQPNFGGRYWTFVRVFSECGIEGIGEIYTATFHPTNVEKLAEEVFERYLKGHDPHHIERFYRACYSSGFSGRPDTVIMAICSGFEMACWDIIGKSVNKPIYELIGGKVRDKIRSYSYLYPIDKNGEYQFNDIDLSVADAVEKQKMGFTAIKFDPAGPYTEYDGHQLSLKHLQRSEDFVREIRNAIGNDCDILFGTHGQMTVSSAVRLAKRLEPYDPLWFEEPIPPGQSEPMSRVAEKTSIPIATGERLTTKYEFYDLLINNSASILQMNLGRVGGILEAKKIASMAECFSAEIAPHVYCGPVACAASVQVATSSPNFLIQECIGTWDGFAEEILLEKIGWENGFIIPNTKPGLGIELDMKVIKKHSPYTGDALHLSMTDKPYCVSD